MQIKLDHQRWIIENDKAELIKNLLRETGISEEKISKIWKIGFSEKKNIKFIEQKNWDKIQTFTPTENAAINKKLEENNISFFKEPIVRNPANNREILQKSTARNLISTQPGNYTFLDTIKKDTNGWFMYAEDVSILKNAIQKALSGKYPSGAIAGIGIDKKGTIKIALINDISKEKTLTKKENNKVQEAAKGLYAIHKNTKSENKEEYRNFFTYLYPQIDNVISEIKNKVYLSKRIVIISIDGNNIIAHTRFQDCSVPFINKEIIENAEKENDSELKNWLESHINNISSQINAAMKDTFIQIQKNAVIQDSINELLQSINSTISKKHFKNQETELFFDNNLSQTKKNSAIQIKVKSKNIAFQTTIPITKQKLQSIYEKFIYENIEEEDYRNINIYLQKEALNAIQAIIFDLIEKAINDKKPFNAISPDQVKKALPEKIKKHIQSYENKEKAIPCWLNQAVQEDTKAIFYPPNEIVFANRFFSEKSNSSQKLIETEYGKSIRALKEAPLKAVLDTAKKLKEKIKKLNLTVDVHKTKKTKENNSVSCSIKLKDNISSKSCYDNFVQEIGSADRNEENNNKIIKLIEEIQAERKSTDDLVQSITNNILYIAVADIIFLNKGSSKSAITANLRGSNTSKYRFYMKNNMFTNKLHLIDKEELENTINKLERLEAINSHSKKGEYGRFDVYYPNNITDAAHTFWETNMDKILKKNNIILKGLIEKLSKTIEEGKAETFTIQDFLPLIDDKINIIDYSINLEALKKVFRYAPDDIIKLMNMKKKLINDSVRIKVYNALIKTQKEFKEILKAADYKPEKLESTSENLPSMQQNSAQEDHNNGEPDDFQEKVQPSSDDESNSMKLLGSINFGKNIIIADPLYNPNDNNLTVKIDNLVPGIYNAFIKEIDTGTIGIREAALTIIHKDYPYEQPDELLKKIPIDTATVGIYDRDFRMGVKQKNSEWYPFISECAYRQKLPNDKAIACQTGFGDGEYPVFVKHDKMGQIYAIAIRFIED